MQMAIEFHTTDKTQINVTEFIKTLGTDRVLALRCLYVLYGTDKHAHAHDSMARPAPTKTNEIRNEVSQERL